MDEEKLDGRLVILTRHLEKWYKELNSEFNVPITNRLAKIVKVFDWGSSEGKLVLKEREKTGKWEKLNPKDFKFVLKIYYPELRIGKTEKVMIEEIVPQYYPGTEAPMFMLMPDWMLNDLLRGEKSSFKVEKKVVRSQKREQ
jgi:hypothetical protein